MNALPRNPAALVPGAAVARAAVAHILSAARVPGADDPTAAAAARWPRDDATAALIRAAASPATTGTDSALAATEVAAFLSDLPQSAAARLMAEAVTVRMGRAAEMKVPLDATDPDAGAGWVAEADPIPVAQGVTDTLDLSPRKLGVILTVSRTIARQPGAEALLRHMLARRAARAFDAALFSTAAGDATRVAGLLHGVTPIAGLSGGDAVAMKADLRALGGALGDAGGSGRVLLAMHPTSASAVALELPTLAWPVLPTAALPVGRIVAVDPAGLAFGTGGELDILTTPAALIHMSSTPAEIVTDAGATADPVRELFQTDGLATRLLMDLAFAARPGAVAYVEGATW